MRIICFKGKKAAFFTGMFALCLAAIIALCTIGNYAVKALAKKRLLPIYSVGREDKKISISFDCAWGTEFTDSILEELRKNNIKCTFFATQFWVEKYPDYAKKVVESGHELGTHSKTHPHMSTLSALEIKEELVSSSSAIETATGVKPTLFRPPFGDYNNLLIETCQEVGLTAIQWDVDSLDWKNIPATQISMRVINGVKSGSIILCHNNGLHTAEALPIIFSTLLNRGYTFVPIGELIYREHSTIDPNGRQILADG